MSSRLIRAFVGVSLLLLPAGCGEEEHGDVQLAPETLFPLRYLERIGTQVVAIPTHGIRGMGFDGPIIPVPPDPYPAGMPAVVAARLASLPGGMLVLKVFASPNCLPEVAGLGTDTDADGIPDDATVTYSVANCTVYDSATGDGYLGRGSYRVRDTNDNLYGFRMEMTDISVRDFDGASGISNDSRFTITETARTTSNGGTYHLVLDGASSSGGPDFFSAQAFRWDITESFVPIGTIPTGGPLPDGTLSMSGTVDFTILENDAPARVVMQIVTQTPMTYDNGCEGFTSGSYETRLVGSPTEGIHVVYSNCAGNFEPIGAGTL